MNVRTSLLPAGLTLVGSIEGKGDLVVAGSVDGPIDLDGELIIEADASVRGDVRASSIVVRGLLAGNAVAKEGVRVDPSATIVGDVTAPRVHIVEGAKVRGRVTMSGKPRPAADGAARAKPSRRRRRPERNASEPASTPAPAATAPAPTTPAPDPSKPRRRKRRRAVRKPPPPTIPSVQRQKARRKDRAVEPTP